MSDDLKLIADARAHGYEYPSVPCSECGEPVYFVPGDMPQDSGHWVYHDHEEEEEKTPTITEWEAEERYEEVLYGIYDVVNICGYEYDAGRALKELDPIAFREGMLAYYDSEGIEIE